MPYPPSWPLTADPGDTTPAVLTRRVDAGDRGTRGPKAQQSKLEASRKAMDGVDSVKLLPAKRGVL